jgi:nitronate monooxygenase
VTNHEDVAHGAAAAALERDSTLAALLGGGVPVWVAPMAGGPSRPELVIGATRAGSFAQLAAGYKTAAAMSAEIRRVHEAGVELFGVNVFVPNRWAVDRDEFTAYARSLRGTADRLGYTDEWALPREDDDDWHAKIDALLRHPVAAVSFTFGLPGVDIIDRLRAAGSLTIQTVTSVDEAVRSERAGIDVLIVQAYAAGGHSGTWRPDAMPDDVPLTELVSAVRAATRLPIAAAGGIATADDVRAVLAAGAAAGVVGTAVLRSPESGASRLHKDALGDPGYTQTKLTRAFTGRAARALVNQFVVDHDAESIVGYPAVHHLTRPIRQAAIQAGDASALNLWAGTGWRSARVAALAELLTDLTPDSTGQRP